VLFARNNQPNKQKKKKRKRKKERKKDIGRKKKEKKAFFRALYLFGCSFLSLQDGGNHLVVSAVLHEQSRACRFLDSPIRSLLRNICHCRSVRTMNDSTPFAQTAQLFSSSCGVTSDSSSSTSSSSSSSQNTT